MFVSETKNRCILVNYGERQIILTFNLQNIVLSTQQFLFWSVSDFVLSFFCFVKFKIGLEFKA